LDIERDLREKLAMHFQDSFEFTRLGVLEEDFETFNLIPLNHTTKRKDRLYRSFIEQHGTRMAEVDAIPASEVRRRVREAIEAHIPPKEWKKLEKKEQEEIALWQRMMAKLKL
jgi:hypothetical protein